MRVLLLSACLAGSAFAQPVQLTDFGSSGTDGVLGAPGVGMVSVDSVLYFPAAGPGDVKSGLWQYSLRTGATSRTAPNLAGEIATVGGRVYVATSSGGAPPTVQEYDPQTGQTRAVYTASKPGDIELTAAGDRLFLIDRTAGGLDAPHLLDPATGQATRVADVSFGGLGGVRVIDQTVYYGAARPDGSGETLWATKVPSGATAEFAPGYDVSSLPVAFDGALWASAFASDDGSEFGVLRKSAADGAVTRIDLVVNGRRPSADTYPFAATEDRLLLIGSLNSVVTIFTYSSSGSATALCSPGGTVGVADRNLDVVVVDPLVYLVASVTDSNFNTSGLDPATLNAETCAIDLLFPDAPFDDGSNFQNGYLRADGNVYASVRTSPNTSVTTELFVVGSAPPDPIALTVQEQVLVSDEVSLMRALQLLVQERVGVRDGLYLAGPSQALAARFLSVDGLFDFGPDVALQIDASGLEGMGDVLALHAENGAGVTDDRWTVATDDALALGSETTLWFQLGALDGPALSNPAGAVVVYFGPAEAARRSGSATPTPLPTTYDAAEDALVVAWPGAGAFEIRDGGPVSTEDGPPVALGLGAPYPNPALDRLTVQYDVPAPAAVRLTMYDALGRRVGTLAEGPHRAGTFTVGVETSVLAPGLYLVRMESDGFTAVRQAVVTRSGGRGSR